ncbi:MAG: hypothetical protein IPP67_07210 [Rhodospirillaceae bacterium]|nr:hypothetical protein [Rhodospirillaceae bacterium]
MAETAIRASNHQDYTVIDDLMKIFKTRMPSMREWKNLPRKRPKKCAIYACLARRNARQFISFNKSTP